jgi:CRISPR/Cas system-associated exonuclease Cas4 (RecB family)
MNGDEIISKVQAMMNLALDRLGQRARGEWKVRPSGIHRCPRAQVLAARLDPQEVIQLPRKLALAFEVGTKTHEIIQGNLPEVPAEETWDSGVMTGHSDLRLVEDGILMDLKTINVEGYVEVFKSGPKPEHIGQVTWYAVQAGCSAAAIVYINKNGTIPAGLKPKTGELDPTYQVLPLEVDPAVARKMDIRAEVIKEHVKDGTLPRYEQVLECRWCEVKQACNKALVDQARQDGGQRFRHINTKVVGTTFRNGGPDWTTCEAGYPLELEWDKDNPHGPRRADGTAQAVKVLLEGAHIGFLPATGSPTAEIVSDHLAAGGTASAKVTEVTGGGPGKKNHGLNIEIELHGSDL